MKKLIAFITFLIAMNTTPIFASGTSNLNSAQANKTEALRIEKRLSEIRELDKKNLNPSEKKAIRSELKEMKKIMSDPGVGIYISGSALLIIIILLILFL